MEGITYNIFTRTSPQLSALVSCVRLFEYILLYKPLCLSDTYKTDVHEACSVQTVTGAANDPRVGGEK